MHYQPEFNGEKSDTSLFIMVSNAGTLYFIMVSAQIDVSTNSDLWHLLLKYYFI